jgi:DNA end-binding protein Ku
VRVGAVLEGNVSMAARAIWKGILHFGSVRLPVKLFSAVQERGVHFRLLHERDHSPVEQKMVHPATGDIVDYEEIQRGLAQDDGSFVVLAPEELEKLEPKASRDIEVKRFVKPELISDQWYLRPYFLMPDGNANEYVAFAEALEAEGKEGIAHWVMRQKEYVGALRARDGYLMLITLRHAEEVIAAEDLPKPTGRKLTPKEAQMAEQLIAAFEDKFDPTIYADEYRERVLEFINAKARGKRIKLVQPTRKRAERDLTDALARSLKQASKKERKVA